MAARRARRGGACWTGRPDVSISTGLDIAARALLSQQAAVRTISHNISNATTPGYSRQRVDLAAMPGGGVDVVTTREAAPAAPGQRMLSFNDAVRKATPAVVNIFTSKETKVPRHPFMDDPMFRYFFGNQFDAQTRRSSSLGSGVIVSDKGYVLTNHHVIEAADEIEISLSDTRRARARVVGTDPETDLAVLKIDLKNVPSITFAPSEQAHVGDIVLAIERAAKER